MEKKNLTEEEETAVRRPTASGAFYIQTFGFEKWKYAPFSSGDNEPQSGGLSLDFMPFCKEVTFKIESTHRGLILCSDKIRVRKVHYELDWVLQYYLCNPLTKEWIEVGRRLTRCGSTSSLVFNPSNSTFKVFIFTWLYTKLKIDVFSSETGEWVENFTDHDKPQSDRSKAPWYYFDGALYRLIYSKYSGDHILCFRIAESSVSTINLPAARYRKSTRREVRGIGGRLCLISESEVRAEMLEIWELVDSSATGKWVLKRHLPTHAVIAQEKISLKFLFHFVAVDSDSEDDSDGGGQAVFFVRKHEFPPYSMNRELTSIYSYNLSNDTLAKFCDIRCDSYWLYISSNLGGIMHFSARPNSIPLVCVNKA